MVRVAVEHDRHREAADRFLETAASEERKDLARLSLDRPLDGGVVQHRHEPVVPQTRERGFELQRFVDRFPDEVLDDLFPPRSEGAPPEPAAEPLDAGKADPVDLCRVSVQHDHPGVRKNLDDLRLLSRLEVVIAEDGDRRNLQRAGDLTGQRACFFRQARSR